MEKKEEEESKNEEEEEGKKTFECFKNTQAIPKLSLWFY